MTPTIGRIVIFHDYDGLQHSRVDRPAIVLAVHRDGDATGDCPDRLDLGIFSQVGYGYIRDVEEAMTVGCWSWPTLVTS